MPSVRSPGCLVTLLFCFMVVLPVHGDEFRSDWNNQTDRYWVGPEYWTNPLQDWQLRNGRLECVNKGKNRNVQLLTRRIGGKDGTFNARVKVGLARDRGHGFAGFQIGIRSGGLEEYRYDLVHGKGLNAGITSGGELFIGSYKKKKKHRFDTVELRLRARPEGTSYTLKLSAHDPKHGDRLQQITKKDVPARKLTGNIGLVTRYHDELGWNKPRFWFQHLSVSGSKLTVHRDRTFGPILWSMYTLNERVLNLTAQMVPLGAKRSPVRFQVKKDGSWSTIKTAEIDARARTATFQISDWADHRDVPYRLAYKLDLNDGTSETHYWNGTIRKNPVDKKTIEVAGMTCAHDFLFPYTTVVEGVQKRDPDLMVFMGDQVYENAGGFGAYRGDNVKRASLDYLRKWYMLGWPFRNLMRNRPSLCLPDDHDVYQGNLWGERGKHLEGPYEEGGYKMPAEWINMVQRTQTSHLPDPVDPEPVDRGIGVYFTELTYGRLSVAVVEDRKFKTGPKGRVRFGEKTGKRFEWITDPEYDPDTLNVPEADLLGERQLDVLRSWAADWKHADMKLVVSQTLFSGVPTHSGPGKHQHTMDLDTGGWPQAGRNRALRAMRKGFAFHMAGDQHLPMFIQYGVNEYGDAPYALCVPSIANFWPRWYLPGHPGKNHKQGRPKYTGQYRDGFDNKITVHGIANPTQGNAGGVRNRARQNSSGFGYLQFHKPTQEITVNCWPVQPNPDQKREPFSDWPRTVRMSENYGRTKGGVLPEIKVNGIKHPVVKVYDAASGTLSYARRYMTSRIKPPVFAKKHPYNVKVGNPDTGQMKTLNGLRTDAPEEKTITVDFEQ